MPPRRLLLVFSIAAFLTACSGSNEPSSADFPDATRSTDLQWVEGSLVAQDGLRVIMRSDASGELFDVDLETVSGFDCRTDCFFRVFDHLDEVSDEDRLCFSYLYLDGGVQIGKFWVDRYACPGRTIPP
jgi:hypothetical protein